MGTVKILVPYRGDNGRRDELWTFTHHWLKPLNYPITVGESPDGIFNRAAAINHAAEKAGDWDVALIMDADTILPHHQLHAAVTTAQTTGKLTAAFTSVVELNQECTDHVMATGDLNLATLGIENHRQGSMIDESSALACPRRLWEKVEGFDEHFAGWSCEDNAFWKAATIMGGPPERIPGHAYHLWHPINRPNNTSPQYRYNQRRWKHYARARTEADLKRVRDLP